MSRAKGERTSQIALPLAVIVPATCYSGLRHPRDIQHLRHQHLMKIKRWLLAAILTCENVSCMDENDGMRAEWESFFLKKKVILLHRAVFKYSIKLFQLDNVV